MLDNKTPLQKGLQFSIVHSRDKKQTTTTEGRGGRGGGGRGRDGRQQQGKRPNKTYAKVEVEFFNV